MTAPAVTGGRLARAVPGVLAVLLFACGAPPALSEQSEPLPVVATPIPLRSDQPEAHETESLVWRGGLELRSPRSGFGGLSGLVISPDGTRLTAVGDKGIWLSLPLRYDAEGRLVGAGEGRIARLRGPDGETLTKKWDRDAEELARAPDGTHFVAFEHNHRVWHYAALSGTPSALAPLPSLDGMGDNNGIEALAVLGELGLLAIAEGGAQGDASLAFLWREGAWSRLMYGRGGGFRPTGATLLPDGDLLVLERRFNLLEGVRIRLVRVPAASLHPGAHLSGTVIATLEPPLSVDNMEGIAARRGAAGETLIYLISDDNFNPLQRTLLLLFVLKE